MVETKIFIFNPFYENTYILYDETNECVIIDPGCEDVYEEKKLVEFIENHGLKPVHLLNTHCHIDHIFGNKFVADKYGLKLEANPEDSYNIGQADQYAQQFGFQAPGSPSIEIELKEGSVVKFGNSELEVFETPGHSKGHVVFYCRAKDLVIGGDVLFRDSVGRTDLPGGDHQALLNSIWTKLFTLPDQTKVFPGHGPATTIGNEKLNNPFLKAETWANSTGSI